MTRLSRVRFVLSLFFASLVASVPLARQGSLRANVERIGTGTVGVTAPHLVLVEAPVVGNRPSLQILGAQPQGLGVIVYSTTPTEAYLPAFGAYLYLVPGLFFDFVAIDELGRSELGGMTVPVTPQLAGSTWFAQAASSDSGAAGGFALTSALAITFGYSTGARSWSAYRYWITNQDWQIGGDFTNDGFDDLLLLSHEMNVAILPASGDGRFEKPVISTPGEFVNAGVVADFDLDGNLDFVHARQLVHQEITTGARFLFGTGTGQLANSTIVPTSKVLSMFDAGDVDLDGIPELVYRPDGCADDTLELFAIERQSDGSFVESVLYAGSEPQVGGCACPRNSAAPDCGLRIVDLDGDLEPEVVVNVHSATSTTVNFKVLDRDPLGSFFLSAASTDAPSSGNWNLSIGDITGNGELNVIASTPSVHMAYRYDANGSIEFLGQTTTPSSTNSAEVLKQFAPRADWDLDGDGIVDLVTARRLRLGGPTGGVRVHKPVLGGPATLQHLIPDLTWSAGGLELDGDGITDLVLAGRGNVTAYSGDFAEFDMRSLEGSPYWSQAVHPAFFDHDGDGRLDWILGQANQSTWYVAYQEDDGSFGPNVPISLNGQFQYLSTLDLDGNGARDLVLVYRTFGIYYLSAYLAAPGGVTQLGTIELPLSTERLDAGDFDGDGLEDVVLMNLAGELATYRFDGSALELVAHQSVAANVRDSRARDLDADGVSELVLAVGEVPGVSPPEVQVWKRQSGGLLVLDRALPIAGTPTGVEVIDWDRDGELELLSSQEGDLSGFDRDAAGAFVPVSLPPILATEDLATLVAVDWNGDGIEDLFGISTAEPRGELVHRVLFGSPQGDFTEARRIMTGPVLGPAVAFADVDGDGLVDLSVGMSRGFSRILFTAVSLGGYFRNTTLR